MSQDPTQHLRVRRIGFQILVNFANSYIQTEADIAKVGEELNALVEGKQHPKVLISFEGVRIVSSSMLAQVVKLHKKIAKAKGKLRLCALTPELRDVLRASQLDKLLDVYDDEKAALADF